MEKDQGEQGKRVEVVNKFSGSYSTRATMLNKNYSTGLKSYSNELVITTVQTAYNSMDMKHLNHLTLNLFANIVEVHCYVFHLVVKREIIMKI